VIPTIIKIFANTGDACRLTGGNFFHFPHWYDYLDGAVDSRGACSPDVSALADVWLIVAAVIQILLWVAAFAAIGMLIYGGFQYTTSQGEPEATGKAKTTIVNALIGLAVAISAGAIITFIAGSIHNGS
jgi:hypothetical protein